MAAFTVHDSHIWVIKHMYRFLVLIFVPRSQEAELTCLQMYFFGSQSFIPDWYKFKSIFNIWKLEDFILKSRFLRKLNYTWQHWAYCPGKVTTARTQRQRLPFRWAAWSLQLTCPPSPGPDASQGSAAPQLTL